ncbi:GTPase HflX [Candidatus Peregrinibacteria bacterium]|nr:GTPase HflX [Candidatus Peregrinibacteria bacterium]
MSKLPRAILVDIIPPNMTPEDSLARLNELESLLVTYGGFVIVRKIQKKQVPDYKTYIGKGKVEELLEDALKLNVEFLIINNLLKPRQLYNLEAIFEKHAIKVWDKIDLILKIFDKHATTKEAKLQIELASLKHLGPRIFKMGLELMRQAGGIGTRGKGETNIEIMKRHIAAREKKIKADLKKVARNQEGQRNKRQSQGFKTVAIVGYTNAGKSCLLQALTNKKVKIKDELFATLDSRIGKVYLPEINQSILVSDTIGFIRDLPPELIEAFKSTLAETIHADLLLHVIDINDFEIEWKIEVVEKILKELKCDKKKMINVFNKIDLVTPQREKTIRNKYKEKNPVLVSASERENLTGLKSTITEYLFG